MKTRRIELEGLLNKRSTNRIDDDCSGVAVIEVAERCELRPLAFLGLSIESARNVLGKLVHIVFGLAEGHRQHELSLGSILEPEACELEIHQLAGVQKPDEFSAVKRVASQPVWMPRENAIGFTIFNSPQHRIKDRSSNRLGASGLFELLDNVQTKLGGKFGHFDELIANRSNLTLFAFRGLASVNENFFLIVHARSLARKRIGAKSILPQLPDLFTVGKTWMDLRQSSFDGQN